MCLSFSFLRVCMFSLLTYKINLLHSPWLKRKKNAKQTLNCISTSTKCALFPSVSDPQAYHDVRLSNKHYSIQTLISEFILLNTVLSINYTLFHFNTKCVVHDDTYFEHTPHTMYTLYNIGSIY